MSAHDLNLAAQLAEKDAEIERLQRERDGLTRVLDKSTIDVSSARRVLEGSGNHVYELRPLGTSVARALAKRDAEIARLRAALRPLASCPSGGSHVDPDQPLEVTVTTREIRTARAALDAEEGA